MTCEIRYTAYAAISMKTRGFAPRARVARGLPVRAAASLLGISPQRVSQLAAKAG
jgi:hypothetical protein